MTARAATPILKRILKYAALVLLAVAVALLLVVWLVGGRVPLRPYTAALVLLDIAAGEKPSRLKDRVPQVDRTAVQFEARGRTQSGDVYRIPGVRSRGGMLLVPGVAEQGKDDPRLVAFAMTLARARFAVLVPDLVNVRELNVSPRDIRDLADAFAYLVADPELSPGGRAGIAAASYAVGPAVLAALEPDIRDKVRFIMGIGGYYDLEKVIVFLTTGHFLAPGRPEEDWRSVEPGEYARWAFLRTQVHHVENASDRQLLKELSEKKMRDADADVAPLAAQLGAEGRPYYELLTNRDPQRVAELLKNMPQTIRRDLDGLNVARRDLSSLRARLILIHGRDDQMIPYTESKALAAAAPDSRLFLLDSLAHVDIGPMTFADSIRLWCAVDALLAERN